jgi:hypothetical protein
MLSWYERSLPAIDIVGVSSITVVSLQQKVRDKDDMKERSTKLILLLLALASLAVLYAIVFVPVDSAESGPVALPSATGAAQGTPDSKPPLPSGTGAAAHQADAAEHSAPPDKRESGSLVLAPDKSALLLGTSVGSAQETFAILQYPCTQIERIFRCGEEVPGIGRLVLIAAGSIELENEAGVRIKLFLRGIETNPEPGGGGAAFQAGGGQKPYAVAQYGAGEGKLVARGTKTADLGSDKVALGGAGVGKKVARLSAPAGPGGKTFAQVTPSASTGVAKKELK